MKKLSTPKIVIADGALVKNQGSSTAVVKTRAIREQNVRSALRPPCMVCALALELEEVCFVLVYRNGTCNYLHEKCSSVALRHFPSLPGIRNLARGILPGHDFRQVLDGAVFEWEPAGEHGELAQWDRLTISAPGKERPSETFLHPAPR